MVAQTRAGTAPGGLRKVSVERFGIDQHGILRTALQRGGDYADLFFEYRSSSSLSYEEGITRSASKGVSLGLGVRVCRGQAV